MRFAGQVHIMLMVFAYEAETKSYKARIFDNGGFSRDYVGDVKDGIWTFHQAFGTVRIEASADGNVTRHFWERTEDGETWSALCEFTSTRRAG